FRKQGNCAVFRVLPFNTVSVVSVFAMENSVSKGIEMAPQFSGYLELKEYQRQTIEAYLYGRDVFVSAQTGYGKSLTFELAPHAFEYLSENNKGLTSRWFSSSFRWSRL
ncbi:ATP-dependent DNA helicase Q-like 3, partial [Paramuricea clavata]